MQNKVFGGCCYAAIPANCSTFPNRYANTTNASSQTNMSFLSHDSITCILPSSCFCAGFRRYRVPSVQGLVGRGHRKLKRTNSRGFAASNSETNTVISGPLNLASQLENWPFGDLNCPAIPKQFNPQIQTLSKPTVSRGMSPITDQRF